MDLSVLFPPGRQSSTDFRDLFEEQFLIERDFHGFFLGM